jgi:hypothetical protein
MSSNISKIERVNAPQSPTLWVDLYLDKEAGMFFADVGGERIRSETKAEAIKKVREALQRVNQVSWREVILVRVDNRRLADEEEEDMTVGTENGKKVYAASCTITYLRRERALNPLKRKETIEREHREDFEKRIIEARERAAYFERSDRKSARADEMEKTMRDKRAIFVGIDTQWSSFNDGIVEYELPYSEEAWAGVRRIAQALHDTQAKLDAFLRDATPEKLAALAPSIDMFKLPPAPEVKRKKGNNMKRRAT